MKAVNRGASVRARLLNRAKADRIDINLILTRYSLERLLYRFEQLALVRSVLAEGSTTLRPVVRSAAPAAP